MLDTIILYFSPINYFISAFCYLLSVIQMVYLWNKYKHKFSCFLFLGIGVMGFAGVLHTLYWGIARLYFAWGNMDIYNAMQAPLPFAVAQGFDTMGIIIMMICLYKFFNKIK